MSVIDQAFVKAYSRRAQVVAANESVQQATDAMASPPDVSINPKSGQTAIVWVDTVADQYLRRDDSHKLLAPHSRSRTASSAPGAPGGPTNPVGEGRSRGSRPMPQPSSPATPSANKTTQPNRLPTPLETPSNTRVDAGHQVALPTTPVPKTDAGSELLQSGILPWIEASSTMFETPLHQSVAGPYYSDSVIVQENYLAAPTAAPTMPLESVSRPAVHEPARAEPAPTNRVAPVSPAPPTKQPKVQPFAAVWEVDAFEFSDTLIALFGDVGLIKSIGFPLDRAVSEGLQTLLITSIEHGAGRTTVATGMAIAAATAGLRVALVDATMATASASAPSDGSSLADALNLDIQFGWIEAIRGGISIAETAIHSIEDQLTVLPLVLPMAGLPPTSDEFAQMIQSLRRGFDLIVIDGPPCTEAAFRPLVSHQVGTATIDAAILVQDMRDASADQANRVMDTLRRDGITGLGMVQNFV